VTIRVLSAGPVLKLRFNSPGGRALSQNRRARRGRFPLRVRADGDPIQTVTATIRQTGTLDRRGRPVRLPRPRLVALTTSPATVTGTPRRLILRLLRRFTPGRYTIVLTGHNPDGRIAVAFATVTLRR
jgi:tRNA A37 threonylcarbamoyladenosine synthetase subunit TsaC/SUA5/YrdC